MNHHGATTLQKMSWLTLGAVSGGILGYMIAEVVVDRITYGPRTKDVTEDDNIEMIDYDKLNAEFEGTKKIPYGSKPSLDELTRDYRPQDEIRIVDWHDRMGENCETIHYYEKDQTFTYESGDIVDDPNGLFIPNVHLHFGEGSPDKDIVYIQNDNLDLVYEIIRLEKYYKVEILGEEDPEAVKVKSPPVKRKRRAAKPKPKPEDELTDEPHETDGKP